MAVHMKSPEFLTNARAAWILIGASILMLLFTIPMLPTILVWTTSYESQRLTPFPVTVDPQSKTIVEDPAVEALFVQENSSAAAAVLYAGDIFKNIAGLIASAPWYTMLASTASSDASRVVVIDPGFRKEQVALAFGRALMWDSAMRTAFLTKAQNVPPYLSEGMFAPGVYVVHPNTPAESAHAIVRDRFEEHVLTRYSPSTAAKVPLEDALTIASMIERETSDKNEMRIISGIIWNRIFVGMRLQIDSTLQYAKASGTKSTSVTSGWWPIVRSRDKFIDSPYNTYKNSGLPPAPISNPSTAAVLAALNPKKTDCLFYFHDDFGGFHCSATYEEHVAMLKKHYGQGK